MISLWAGLSGFACAFTLWAQHKQQTAIAAVFKILASLAFFLPAVFILIINQNDIFSVLLTMGFGLSLVGDVLLINTKNKRLFLSGLLAFLLAHLAYTGAFIGAGIKHHELMMASVVVMAAMMGCYVWLFKYLKGLMKTAVSAYLVAIGLMLITAIVTRHSAQQLIVAGAILFALSDLFVARQRFVSPGFNNRLVGLPLYYAGQLILLKALLSV